VTQKTYSYSHALKQSLAYFGGDELAASSWLSKYAMKDREGRLLESEPDAMHKRMSREFAKKEKQFAGKKLSAGKKKNLSEYGQKRAALTETKIHSYFKNFRYIIPQGSVMATLGNPHTIASLSNCIVLPKIYDSYGGILYTDQQLAQLFKRRCGIGIDISTLRPSGMFVLNAAGTTSGAVSFMERFSNTTREVAQNGRRGALMITMDVAHPDIQEFVRIKQDLSKVTGANVSVKVSDEFMNTLEKKGSFRLRFPVDAKKPLYSSKIQASELWNTIIHCAHHSAEPGIIFWDRQHHYSTSSVYPEFENISTNPCSEIAMQGGDSCRLMAINLFSFVTKPFSKEASFDFALFYEVVYEAQRLMDDLVELELEAIDRILAKIKSDPEPAQIKSVEMDTWKLIYENGKKGRRTGLGFTALADTFAALGFAYDSEDALKQAEQIMRTKCRAEFDSSIDMGLERGSFQAFDPAIEKTSGFVGMLKKEFPEMHARMMKSGRRNISLSTVAPTGTLSLLSQSSSGIEPVFMLSYTRRRKVNEKDVNARIDFKDAVGDSWQEFNVYHPKLKLWMELSGETDIRKSPYYKSTAGEINWEKRIDLQSVIQKYVTHSISSTFNLPATVPVETIGQIYRKAWKKGLKGVTIYREGSRSGVLVSAETDTVQDPEPETMEAEVFRFQVGKEPWLGFIGLKDNKPFELFSGNIQESFSLPADIQKGRLYPILSDSGETNYEFHYQKSSGQKGTLKNLVRPAAVKHENDRRSISEALNNQIPLAEVFSLLEVLQPGDEGIHSWKSSIRRALARFIPNGTAPADHVCPVCSDPDGIIYEEGCMKCKSCGYSLCL
jgi:ribonucleoside-diphosphate reductase alpha chain